MIVKCECFQIQPKDRDYNKKGKPREAQVEILGGGLCYSLKTNECYGLLIYENEDSGKPE